MKILLSSHFFHPSVGGIEEVSFTLAHEFVKAGHEVKVVTRTAEDGGGEFPFEIVRLPSVLRLCRLVAWCDVFFHNNISLQTAWPLLFIRRPWIVAHHTWIARMDGTRAIRDRIKHFVIRFAVNISVSAAVADHLGVPSVIIGNPYRDRIFRIIGTVPRERDLVFLGRLVWDKGVDLLISALSILKNKGMPVHLTVIGSGSEMASLRQQAQALDLGGLIDFVGTRTGDELVKLLNAHKIMVIPSRWQEPFGLVALEGIACGCVAIGAECGGLPGVIGPGGVTFSCGEVKSMAVCIESLLTDEQALEQYRVAARRHLRNHTAEVVARRYLNVLEAAMQ